MKGLLPEDRATYSARRRDGYSMLGHRQAMTSLILEAIMRELRVTPITELESLAYYVSRHEAIVGLQVEWDLELWQELRLRRN